MEDGNGYSFCMKANATRIAKGESCKGLQRNCEEGLICKRNKKERTRTCMVPVGLDEDCTTSPCEKKMRCHKKKKVCVERKGKGKGKGNGKGKGKGKGNGKGNGN